jgi:hypothetical protein
MEGRWKEVEGK